MQNTPFKSIFPWLMLISRIALFFIVQALIASILRVSGVSAAWAESARWWIFSVTITNVVSIVLLNWLFRLEGKRYLDVLRFERKTFWRDLALAIGAFVLSAPIASIPATVLANRFFGDSNAPVEMMFRPLPMWAIATGLLFPITIAFAELPTYFGYTMPRLQQQLGNPWLAWVIASFFLSIQHLTLPLILDWRFILWRAFMFLPFALYVGLVIKLRPKLLPYLVVGHFLIDLLALSTYLMQK
jgi:uncharacterized membrane protein YtjA (UPF0391 family)